MADLKLGESVEYDENDFWIEGDILVKYYGSAEDVVIPSCVKIIGDYSFGGCQNIKSVKINDGVTQIKARAFENCYSLKALFIPDSVVFLGAGALKCCTSLERLRLSSYLTEISSEAFMACVALKFVYLPDGIKKVGRYAFYGCKCLERIACNKPLSSIEAGDGAYKECPKLRYE